MRHSIAQGLKVGIAALLATACTPSYDMQGNDPYSYYQQNPIANKVETRHQNIEARFTAGKAAIEHADAVRGALRPVSPEALDNLDVKLSPADMKNTARRDAVLKMLRGLGYSKSKLSVSASDALPRDAVRMEMTYLEVVLPNCPDWRTSPVTTYSNTMQGNFKCATETNLGLMVADPHDLVRGSGSVTQDTERNTKVLREYRAGKNYGKNASQGDTSIGNGDTSSGNVSTIAPQVSNLNGTP